MRGDRHPGLPTEGWTDDPPSDGAALVFGDDSAEDAAQSPSNGESPRPSGRRARRATAARADVWCTAFVHSATDAIIGMTLDGTIMSWNPAAERLYGYKVDEVIGRSISVIVPRQPHQVLRRLRRALQNGPRIDAFTIRMGRDDRRIDVQMTIAPVFDEHGTVIGVSGITRDNVSGITRDNAHQQDAERRLTAVRADLESRIVASAAQLRASNAELQKQIRARERLAGRLLTLQDEERRRLGRELHDSTGQNLVALDMNLARLTRATGKRDDAFDGTLADSRALVEESLREIRTLSYLLHPPLLDEAGLTSAVRWYADGFARRSGIAVTVDIDPAFGRLPREGEMALFRVTQESLTNVHRHAASPTVSIRLKRRPTAVILEVEDAGHGMNPEHLVDTGCKPFELGVGISGMRERLRRLGGQLIIASGSGGTSVRATLPLRRDGSIPMLGKYKDGEPDSEAVSNVG